MRSKEMPQKIQKNRGRQPIPMAGWVTIGLFAAQFLPYVLRASFFMAKAEGLSVSLRSAISVASFAFAWVFLCLAIYALQKRPVQFDDFLFTVIRTGICTGFAVYLEMIVFRTCFGEGVWTGSLGNALAALLMCILLTHSELWLLAIAEKEDDLWPEGKVWIRTWNLLLKKPLAFASGLALNIFLLWIGTVAGPYVSEHVFSGMYRSVIGSVFLMLVLTFVLSFPLTMVLQMLFRTLRKSRREEENDKLNSKVEESLAGSAKETGLKAAVTSGSAEEFLVEKGYMTTEEAYAKPEAFMTDEDIPESRIFWKRKWIPADAVPAFALICLIVFVIANSMVNRITPSGKVEAILLETEEAVEQERRHGHDLNAAYCYYDGVSDLTAFDAFLTAIAGGVGNDDVNEEESQISYYVHIFDEAQNLAEDRTLPYLLEAKLLLMDQHAEEAARVLEEFLVEHPEEEEAYLLLLRSYKESGQTDTAAYNAVRKTCVSRRVFVDTLSYMENITIPVAESVSASIREPKDSFYLEGRLLEWDINRRSGNYEVAYNGLYNLLSEHDGRYARNLRVLRAFVETGAGYHVRADGSEDMIADYYALTAAKALEYDQLYTVALAAGEENTYSLQEIKEFAANALVSCRQYVTACDYISNALERFPDSQILRTLFISAYTMLPDDVKAEYNPYRWLD